MAWWTGSRRRQAREHLPADMRPDHDSGMEQQGMAKLMGGVEVVECAFVQGESQIVVGGAQVGFAVRDEEWRRAGVEKFETTNKKKKPGRRKGRGLKSRMERGKKMQQAGYTKGTGKQAQGGRYRRSLTEKDDISESR